MTDAFGGVESEPFWDDAAPYEGPNLYARHEGQEVTGLRTQVIQFKMRPGDQCIARGVMLLSDDRVYIWSVRAEGHADMNGRRRLATLSRQSFADTARGLFKFERDRIEPDLLDHYQAQIDAL